MNFNQLTPTGMGIKTQKMKTTKQKNKTTQKTPRHYDMILKNGKPTRLYADEVPSHISHRIFGLLRPRGS
jgi:ATP-dependent Clp protease adapter protein ClpS